MWTDYWLDEPGSGHVIYPRRDYLGDVTLDIFIDQGRKVWRTDLVRATFLPLEADKVLSIPISCRDVEDKLCWVLSGDGVFRVKDAYSHALSLNVESSCSSGLDPIWRRLWKLKVPPKVCEFSWWPYWDIIPHGVNLSVKGVSNYILCRRRGKEDNLKHLIVECPWSQGFWSFVNISFPIPLV